MKKALITGITGQDGSYLAELLLEKGYEVHGLIRRHASGINNLTNIYHIKNQITLHEGDLLDETCVSNLIRTVMPDELYNLAAQSHVRVSSDMPIYTSKVNGISVVTLLEAIRLIKPECKFYQASTSEMFGNCVDDDGFQRETTPMSPNSPYACAKLFAHNICIHYRDAYNMFISPSILMNHESPRRGIDFVTQKIVQGALAIYRGEQSKLELGNLDSYRDWGHAKDYVRAMWMILQHSEPDVFVIASGETHSVREFCEIVFKKLGMDYKEYVVINPRFYRPQELDYLKGDSSKAKNVLGWKREYTFEKLIDDMLGYDSHV